MNTTTKEILNLTPNTNYSTGIIIAILLSVVMFTCIILIEYGIRKQMIQTGTTAPHIPRLIQILLATIFIFSGIYAISGYTTIQTAQEHGMYQKHMTWSKIITSIEHSPKEDKLPENLKNTIILYYKFGCEDCESIYEDQTQAFHELKNVYWISTRSEQGKTLRKTYPVNKVPSGVYITNDLKPVVCDLTIKSKGKITLHDENVKLLLSLYHSNHKSN